MDWKKNLGVRQDGWRSTEYPWLWKNAYLKMFKFTQKGIYKVVMDDGEEYVYETLDIGMNVLKPDGETEFLDTNWTLPVNEAWHQLLKIE